MSVFGKVLAFHSGGKKWNGTRHRSTPGTALGTVGQKMANSLIKSNRSTGTIWRNGEPSGDPVPFHLFYRGYGGEKSRCGGHNGQA
jgi:hypothetical protein